MKKIFFILIVVSLLGAQSALAEVMNSSNYSIQSDSINFGGGYSSSANYIDESTFGEVAPGESASSNYNLKAGYQQMYSSFLSISAAADITLSPSIDGTVGGVADGSTSVTVITDDPAGYQLYIKASSSPALVSGVNFFTDYVPAGVNPDLTFTTPAASSRFGFSPEGSAITAHWKDNGSACGVGSGDTVDACWEAIGTTNKLIASQNTGNYPAGTVTTLKFRAASGSSNLQPAGTYTATTTVTAIAL